MLDKIALGVAGFSLLQFWSLSHPRKFYSDNIPDMDYQSVTFVTQDAIKIVGWWIPGSRQATATIIVGHGYPFDKGNIFAATKWLHPKFNLLYYDHRSFGQSQGSITTGGIREAKDIEAAIKFVRTKTEGPIGLYGFSLSAAAMLMADHTHVSGIVADSTYATLENVINHLYSGFGPLRWLFANLTKLFAQTLLGPVTKSPLQGIAKTKVPVFLIHSQHDTQIPVENSHQLYAASDKSRTKLKIVSGVDHGRTLVDPNIRKAVIGFFASLP